MARKRMAVYLSKLNSFPVNHKKVARLMRLHGLNSRVRPNRRCSTKLDASEQTKETFVNFLNRDFSSTSPMKKLVTDMTFIPVVEGWLVLSTVKDLFNHKIVAWETAPSATLQLALNILKSWYLIPASFLRMPLFTVTGAELTRANDNVPGV